MSRPTVLVTGASGGFALDVAELLKEKYSLVGIDPRPMNRSRDFPGEFFQLDYAHRKVREIFKNNSFETVIHMGRVRKSNQMVDNFRVNVLGTKNLLEVSRSSGTKNFIILSTYHVYGANAHNYSYLTEETPLRANVSRNELADAVELDHAATAFMWQNPDIRTVILRPCNIVGPGINNSISMILRSDRTPRILGYDPLMQFIHSTDAARAITTTLDPSIPSGIYNVVGEGALPVSKAIELAGSTPIPVPPGLAQMIAFGVRNLTDSIPTYLLEFFRYPVVISDDFFRETTGFEPEVDLVEALKSLRR